MHLQVLLTGYWQNLQNKSENSMQNVYTVAQVNSYIKNMFTQDYMLQSVSVRGEVSNCKYHSSGHIYFTLKDKLSVMACVMFAGNRAGLSFPLKENLIKKILLLFYIPSF